ncbi:hypothetical protein PMIN07_006815 [Paraphaeosphaeria minitans]
MDIMASENAQVHSCQFPSLGRGSGSEEKRPLSVRVELQHPERLQKLFAEEDGKVSFVAAVRTAWALVLRTYTGLDQVCFGLGEVRGDESPGKDGQRDSVVAHLVSDEVSIAELIQCKKDKCFPIDQPEHERLQYNTSVLFRFAVQAGTASRVNNTASTTMAASCHLRLLIKVLKTGISLLLEYRNSYIPTEFAKSIATTTDKALDLAISMPHLTIREADLLSERNRIQLEKWNSKPLAHVDRTIHDTVAEVTRQSPHAEAIASWDGSFTYRELDEYACRLAGSLIELGVGADVIVPLCFRKTRWNVVAVLGVLIAGGAFLPLDPAAPRERLEYLVSAVGASVVLCSPAESHLVDSLAENIFAVDDTLFESLPPFVERPQSRVDSHNAAYVIPTSGTTGQPKLSLLEHGNYCTGASAHYVGLGMDTKPLRALQFAAHSFDSSVLEILSPLMFGGTICIPDENDRLNDISKVINDMHITWASLTPTFVRFLQPSMVPTLSTIILMGEAMSQANLDTWSRINLINGYGPSECAVCSSSSLHMQPTSDPKDIGFPVGCNLWVVAPENRHRRLPIGCTGELLVEGHIAARGYLGDEEKTAQAFVTDISWAPRPFRGYLTGDLVVQRPDGGFTIVGRKDNQVKYHGQRIELLEIEYHLNLDSLVKHNLVFLPKSGPCKERLVAVVSLAQYTSEQQPLHLFEGHEKTATDTDVEAIRARLSTRLPFYMVPTVWIAVVSLPLLASGKLDRKRTSQWLDTMSDETYQRVVPANVESQSQNESASLHEDILRSVWARVLNLPVEQIGLNKAFLSLGGDSISAMQVMGYCRKQGISVGVQEILRSRSIAELATMVKDVQVSADRAAEEIDVPFDLTPIQSLWFQLPNQGHGHFNQSFYLQVKRKVNPADFRAAIDTLVSRHSMLRARFALSDDRSWQQCVTNDVSGSYRFRHESVSTKEQVDHMIEDSQKCLNHATGPLLAADLFEIGKEQHAFLVAHHLVIDLVSWRLILEELEELLTNGSLLPPALPFQTWAQLQREHAQMQRIDKVLPPAEIPALDFNYWGIQHASNTYGNAGHASFELDQHLTSLFLGECHAPLKTEPVEVILASLLHSWVKVFDDRPIPAIYNEGHGREPWDSDIDITRTVGWFTTVYPIYVTPSHDPLETIRMVKDFRRQIPFNGRPYFAKRVLTKDGNEHFDTHWPMEISFNYLGQYQQLERQEALLQPLESMAGETREAGGTADVGHASPRFGLFEISAIVFKGQLKFAFTFNRNMQHQERIRDWVSNCGQVLTDMIETLPSVAPRPTLSDFPLLTLNEDRFQAMLHRLSRISVSANEVESAYPCSSMQEGLLLSQSKNAGFYAAVTIHELTIPNGHPKWEDIADSWARVVARHPALRTIFLENIGAEEGLYDQVVLKSVEPNIVHLQCATEEEALELIENQRSVTYEDSRSPPHRFTICSTADDRVFCCLEISHAIMDGHSMSLLFRDLRHAYGKSLAEDGPPYADYIAYLMNQPQEASLDFWKSYLKGSEVCSFPMLNDGISPERQLQNIRVDCGSISILDLHAFCSAHGITLSNIFHTAWAITLSLYVDSPDVTFGYLTSARDSDDIRRVQDMVGPIINMLACRVQLTDGARSLLDVIRDVQRDYVESIPHRHIALAEVQHMLNLGGANLFNTALSYRRLPPDSMSSNEKLQYIEKAPIYDPTEYPVSINIEVSDEATMIDLDFWTDHLSPRQAENVASTFVRTLENVLHNAENSINSLDNLSGRHWQRIQDWNVIPETIHECVHHRFQEWVKIQPDAPAIRGHDGDYTYAELDAVTERLAHYLVDLGVGPEVFVPTCFDKSSFAVVAMLAVLKAGGAAVPLDAKHPKPALESRVEDTQAQVVLTTAARSEQFEDIAPDVIVVDSVLLEDLSDVERIACTDVEPHNAAFVIFTSGSTGRPKGVVLEHAAFVTSAYAHGSRLGVDRDTRFLQFASYTFDNSLEEMFTTLQRGGCVCVPSEEDRMNDLACAIARLNANFMDLTPTVASLLNPKDVPTIKSVALGGEALTKAVLEQWTPYVHVMGQYGPSEASVNSAFKSFRSFKQGDDPTNIGRAVGSVSWIVDPKDRNRLAPIGCKGELLIEGPILARGYLQDPEKTLLAFIHDPAWARSSDGHSRRFYCTGDLVHYTGDGELMYLGRKDSQVKLNGQRIELGEIEYHLNLALPSNAQSAVELVKFTDSKGTKALVGFVCLAETSTEAIPGVGEMTDDVRAKAKEAEVALANVLPAYYVPSMFMPLNSMPMTTSGKLDRKVLRQLAQAVPEDQLVIFRLAGKSGRAPSGPVETTLARLWSSLLNLPADSVGANDSFFRLGGDSIGAMRLVTASRKEGLVLAVSNIFSQPQLAELAATASILSSDELSAAQEPEVAPFELISEHKKRQVIELAASECGVFPDSIEDIYPCSRLQEGLIALSATEPGSYVAETIYRLPADVDVQRFQDAWNRVVAEEAILRTRIIYVQDQGFIQVVLRNSVDWSQLESLQDISNVHRHLPVKPGAPLASYAIIGQGTSSVFFVWTAHHAVYDGWSLTSLLGKVESYYQNSTQASHATVPYSRFIKYVTSLDPKQADDFWRSMFEDTAAPQFPQLPSPDHKVEASGQLCHHIPVTRRSRTDITMPSMIRAAWGLVLSAYSGSDDILWGETNSGREVPVSGIEDIIGATITTSPMRLKLDRQLTVQEYLQEVQRQTSAAIPHQFAGLQHIRKLNSDTAAACDFQSLLVITSGDSMKDPEGGLWNLQSTGAVGTNFFNYGLIFNCFVNKNGIEVEAHYDGQVIHSWLVQRLLQQFDFLIKLLNGEDALQHVLGNLSMLNPADEAVISSWNSRPVNVADICIHDSVSQSQVILRPTSIAIDSWDTGEMSYREFDERTTRLASRLIYLGVKPQSYVPICFEKSGWTIVAMFAIMKCGAAFVPLDFEAPLLRLREIVGDVKAELILCDPQHEELCKSISCKVLVVHREATEQHTGYSHNQVTVHSDTTAYVIFTSGSTGKPKGAVISHRAFSSASAAFAPAFGISENSRVLQFSSYTFDACLIEIFSTFVMGGTVCVPDQSSRTNDLAGVINKFRVNLACLTPSVVRMIQPSQVPSLKTLLLVGEAMSQQDLLTWADRVILCNGYGPTECSAIATVNVMSATTKPNNLGKVVTARGWVVSRNDINQLVPVGAVGELVLEGGGVGSGYLNNPAKTADAYVEEVNWTMGEDLNVGASRRFYKTGDLVKYNEDGTLLYLGRKDNQTKVRGQRLELNEVEHHLIQDSVVQNALASVPKAGPCAKRLVGIVSLRGVAPSGTSTAELQLLPEDTASFNIATIRERLEARLPSYMIPSLWIAISRFPLMPSGKLDRKKVVQWLENMDNDTYRTISTLGMEETVEDADLVDRKLQTIFAKVLNLGTEDIRMGSSFLRLGGDSIAAMQVCSMCRAQGLAVSVQDIVKSKSIAALAAGVSISRTSATTKLQPQDYSLPFDLSPIQKLFFATVGDSYGHFNQSTIFKFARSFEPKEIEEALNALVETHPMLRARYFQDESMLWKQSIAKIANPFRLRHHQVKSAKEEFMRPVIDESQATLDIVKGPAFSADLFDIDDNFSQVIALVVHHLVIDIVSWGVIIEDFESLLNGTAPPPQSLPFHAWTQQQAAQALRECAEKVMPLANIPPADFDYWGLDASDNLNGDVISEDIELSPKDSMLILGAHDALATEPVDVFIAALLESFRKVFPDRHAATIHNEGHGREPFDSQDLSRTVGWCTTMVPIHLPVAPEDPTDIVSTIRWVSSLREKTPGKGRPYFAYRLLIGEGQDRFASHWPAEVTFNYLGRMQNMERKDALLQRMTSISTTDISAATPRLALFEVTALVAQGTIKLSFDFNRRMSRQSQIKSWMAACKDTLVDAVDQLLQLRSEHSLDNFKLLPLTYNGTSKLSALLPTGTTIDEIEDVYPASPMQQGMLLSQLKNPELYSYHCILEIKSTAATQQVNPRKIAEAWQVVVQRHPILRTVFVDSISKTGLMDQVVFKERPGRITWIADCDTEDVARFLRNQPLIDFREFNCPHRLTIFTTKANSIWAKLEMSHAICDGTSIPIILNDLARAYGNKLTRADAGPLYSNFIAHTLTNNRDADVNFWKAYLTGVEPCFFPVLHDGVPGPHEMGSYELHLQDIAPMTTFCRKFGVTLSNVLQLAWALLLHAYVGAPDVSFGVVASGRDVPVKGIDEAVGCFVNMLICRLELSDDSTVHQLLEKIQTHSVDAMAHQGCSLADLQHELQLPSLFNTVFTYQRRQLSRDPTKTALTFKNIEAADPGEFLMTLNVEVSDEGASIDFGFWKDRLHPSQARNIVDAFEKILSSIISSSDKDVTVTELDMLTTSSVQQIMEWNADLPPPVRRCVHDVVQEQVLLRPRSTKAIESAELTVTYQEFDEITTRLALHLQGHGVGPETFVPILFEKSPWAPIAMIAIMKAGGAYVPLDPKHPPARLRELIGDVSAKIALCSRMYHSRASEVIRSAIIVDRLSINKLPLPKGVKLKSNATPENPAYCLFTSGTTGKPKGTIIPHEAYCTNSAAFAPAIGIHSNSRTFQFASYTFDASCLEILSALMVGATICVPTEDERMSDPAGAIRRMGATWSLLTPSVLSTLKPTQLPTLKNLCAGGEAVPAAEAEKWQNRLHFVIAYGPTETAVIASTIHKTTDVDGRNIGLASACRLWVVHPSNHDKLMPIGAVGELVIEGYTVARGYLGDEAKTAKAFITNPAWASSLPAENGSFETARMYKSGDLVRYNPDGTFGYIGRKDTQIKLNGRRIELAEIEFHVNDKFADNIQSAVELVAPASRTSAKALAVFFAVNDDPRASSTDVVQPASSDLPQSDELLLPMDDGVREVCKSLENALVGFLPAYMIPSIFFPMKKLPWTPAGKLDRNRLRVLVQNLSKETLSPYRLANSMHKKKPTTEAERRLQKLVSSVLNLPLSSVGADDSFIRLGGDSIAAMRLVAAAQAEHLDLSVIDIFKRPKISDLAAKCKISASEPKNERSIETFELLPRELPRNQVIQELSDICRIPKNKIQDAYPPSPLQEAFIALSIKQPGAYVAQHILVLAESVDVKKFKAAWEKVVQEIDLLRTRIVQIQTGAFIQAVLVEDPISWREVSTLEETEGDAANLPTYLGGKLATYAIVRTASAARYFVWTIHHALYDGWSIAFMLQRVQQIYQSGSSKVPKVPYTKFIQYLQKTSRDASAAFWKHHLAGAAPYQFPQQHSNISETPDGQTLQHTAKLIPQRHTDMTPPTFIRAAWALLLSAYTGSNDVIFGETLTGRDIAVQGVTDICGPTLTTVPTRVQVNRDGNVLDLLRSIAHDSTDRIPHQHFGLSELKRMDENTSAACDFQNLLIIQTDSEQPAESMWSHHNNGVQGQYFTYPLVVECQTSQTSISFTAYYDANVISTWEVQRILYQFDAVLSQLNSVGNIRDVHVFSVQDAQFVSRLNAAEPLVVNETMPSLFFQQVSAHPHATAVSAFDGDFTYGELRDLASQLAQMLIRLGAGPEKLVPICMDKSCWAIVAIMGVLISGAGYVPLSPDHPASRHRQIIQDCNASIALCSPQYESRMTDIVEKVITTSKTTIHQLSTHQSPLTLRAAPENICYVLYTSGSTGVPKGVAIEHRAIATSSAAMCKSLNIKPTSRVFQFASFVFDVSVMEILTALSCGAVVCVPSEEIRTTDIALAINSLKATWTCLTPSVANVIESPESVPTLQTFASAADPLTPETIKKWGSGLQLLNAYGPTEASVIALSNKVASIPGESTIIGRALDSGRAWLTNSENPHQLAPVGAVAELCLEGPFLARGYWNNHAKTAEVFVENPKFMKKFSKDLFTRIYRTGDLVRYASDGRVHYLGRKDNQIKLAGQRMELGEIEHHLQADETVKNAVVILPKSGAAKRKLTAVVSLHRIPAKADAHDQHWDTPINHPDVLQQIKVAKDRLSDLVPPYMVPTLWIAVPRIPALASAKLDRKQVGAWLADMNDETYRMILDIERSMEPVIPSSKVVMKMQGIWAKVLNMPVENVKSNKTWLSLGGDSITAMQLLARCRKEGINITLNQVLRSKSLAHLAESVGASVIVDFENDKTDTPFALSPIQRFYFRSLDDDKNSHFNQSFTLKLSRKMDSSSLKAALDAIVHCHSMLRARFTKDTGGIWNQIIPGDLSNAYAFNFHNGIPLSDIPELISKTQKSLNIVSGPVFATMLLNTETGEQILFLTAHHLVIDVVSWRIILGDLEEILISSSSVALQKGLSFATWNEKQILHTTNAAQTSAIQKQFLHVEPADLAFWGLDKRPNVYGDVEREMFSLDEKISASALSHHSALRTDIVDLFLAAIVHSFSRVFVTRKTPTIFNETHGREPWEFSNLDLSRTVGWFTTLYPVHVAIAEDEDDVIQTVRRVKDLRRKVTDNGRPYFAHRFLTKDGQAGFAEHEPMEILFNYLGKMQQLEAENALFQPMHFSEDDEARMTDTGADLRRLALFEVSASVDNGKIQLTFMYNQMMKNRKGIRRWIAECQRTLEEIVSALSEIDTPQPTLSDFPLLPLDSYDRLNRVIKSLASVGVSYPQVEDIYPCAAVQEGMILSQIKDPSAYWSFTTFELKAKRGRVDVQRVLQAWKHVVDRHQALRTLFVDSVSKGGVFDQVVVRVPETGALAVTCTDDELNTKLDSIQYRDLNGKKKPHLPHQLAVVQTTSGRVVVKMEINHVVIDGGSLAVIRNDLEEAYEGRLRQEDGPLYSDYIKYLRALPMKDSLDFWKGKLRGVRPCHFPIVPQHSSKQRQLHSLYVKFDRFSDIQVLAERNNITFANILLAAWSLVLHTYTSSSEVCYGYLTSGRNVPINGIENAVGAFINMLVSRVEVSSSRSLLAMSESVQKDFIESVPYQHCSLAQFQHDLGLSGQALFNTAVSVQNQGATEGERASQANVEFLHLDGGDPSEFALTVNIDTTRNDEGVRLAYWTDSVSDEEAKNVSSLLVEILTQVLADPGQTVAELDAVITNKPKSMPKPRVYTPSVRSPISSPYLDIPDPMASARIIPKVEVLQAPTPTTMDAPDWSNLIRSIVSEMVPQIVNQVMEKNKLAPIATQSTVSEMTNQMAGMLARRASTSKRGRNLESASIRSRRLSTASDTGSRIQTAADMVAAAGVMATEALKSVPPDFVEKKLLGLWSDLLDMVEDSIDKDDSFFQLGGDSIIAMRLVGAAREEGLSMTVADVFKNPTFADMARVVRVAGEVIDEVMSRAGGESLKEARASSSKPKIQIPERTVSAWRDFQSMVSEQAIDDKTTEGGNTPPAQQERQLQEKTDQMFKKWTGFANGQNSRPQLQRTVSQKPIMPQTIQEDSAPKSISLLGDPNVDSVISKVQVFKGGITDVLPVTDFQALAITGTLLESKWMLNYFYLDGEGPLDLRKLKQACFRIVQAFDILRTVFVPYGDRFLQVVLRKLQPDFHHQETDESLDDFTTELRHKDQEHGPRLGEAFVKFVVAKQKASGRYRIFMRLSHAQYDGFCFSKMLTSLQAGYNGLPVSTTPSFGNFVRESAKAVAGAHDHWREVLRGSKMTEIVHRYGPNYQRSAGRTVTLKQTLKVPSLSQINITTATVMKAAWAATLSRVAGKSDIVFGHVVSGRSGGVPNVENIIGPCLNMVPVRVVYRPEWTVFDLLGYIQEQQINNMAYESLGFREITRNCTDWPDWTNFSSVLQHNQNIQSEDATLQLGGIEFKIGAAGNQEDFADISILSASKARNEVEVTLTYAPNSTLTAEFTQDVFDMLCANVITFSEDPYTLLPAQSEIGSQSSTTITSETARKKSSEKKPLTLPTDTGLSKHELATLSTKLRSAWEQNLRDENNAPPAIDLASDFFQLGGDIQGIAQIASIFNHEDGWKVRVEDLLDKPVFVDQVGLLAAERKKQIEKEEMNPWGEKRKIAPKGSLSDKEKLERRQSGLGALARKIGLKRKDTHKEAK